MITYLLAAASVILSAWTMNVLAADRVLPWQATARWASTYVVAVIVLSLCYLPAWRLLSHFPSSFNRSRRQVGVLWAFGPTIIVALLSLAAFYLSDEYYGFLMEPSRRMQIVALVALAFVTLGSLSHAAALWASDMRSTLPHAIRSALVASTEVVLLASLLAIGSIAAVARSTPVGDDLGQYLEVALSLLAGTQYPIHQAPSYYVEIGMSPNNPAMPALSVLMYLSFLVFGPTLSSVAIVLAGLKAVFPALTYLASRSLTRSRLFAFVAAVLIFLFPVYQLHVLGGPEPDTLFADLLLLSVVLAVKASRTQQWPWWAALGFTLGLVANTRYEGLSFSLAILLVFVPLNWSRTLLPVLAAAYLLTLAPFAITYFSRVGSAWPSSFGGTVSPRNVEANLALLKEIVLPWHLQAVGLNATGLALLSVGLAGCAVASLAFLWKTNRSLLFVPCLGAGYFCSSLLIHPLILNPYSAVDVFRHWSSAIPYLWLSATCGLYWGARSLARRLPGRSDLALALLGLALAAGIVSYEADRLAHPEWYLGGRWSLLWTGGSYLVTDVMRESVPIPSLGDTRSGEELRREQTSRLEPYNLRYTNAGEPYHWTTLIVALFGLLYGAVPATIDLAAAASPIRRRWSAESQPSP